MPAIPSVPSTDAIAVVSMAIHRPLEAETIAFFLDDTSRSNTITVVSGTTDPDSVLSVAECMSVGGRQIADVVWCGAGHGAARGRTKLAGNAAGRHRPMDRGQRDHRVARHRADRVVRRRPGRRRLPARTARRAAAMVNACLPDPYRRARRSAGLSRRPAARKRRSSSRLDVNDAPASIRSSKYSSGTS